MADEAKPAVKPVKKAAKAVPKGDADEKVKAKALETAKAQDEAAEEEEAREPQDEPAPKKAAAKPPKKAAKDDASGDDEPKEKGKKKAAPRPSRKLSPELKKSLELRREKNAHRQAFSRQEGFRYQRLGDKWRAPQGIQSKMRRHWGTHADVVSIGYRGPKAVRGLHPSGYEEVMVHNEQGLEPVDAKTQAVRIAGSVGRQKRELIQKAAAKAGIRVLNWKKWEKRR